METLAEPGLLPHGHYPMAMNGYYSKQDAPSYYYHHSSTNRPPHNYNYTGYAPAPQGETRPGDQMYSPTDKYPAHDSDKPAQFHHYPQELQPHPYQHQIPDASSVYFPHNNPNIGSSHKDKTTPISDPNSSDVEGSESSFTEEKPNTKNNVENQNIPERKLTPRVPQDISVNLDKLNAITSPGEHNANSDSEEVLPPPSRDQRSLYYRHQNQIYHEEMQQAYYNQTRYMHGRGNVKDNYMMYGQKEPTVIKSEIDPDNNWHSNNRQNEKANPQFTERLALQTSPTEVMRSMSVQRKDYHGVSMNPIYHMEAMNNFYNYNHKADTITSVGRWDKGETITAGGRLDHKTPFPGLLHDRQKNPEVGTPNKLINNVRQHLENTTSPTSLHNRRMMSPEKYPRMAYHQSLDLQSKPRLLEGMLSPSKISSELKQHYQHHPNLYSPSAGKPSILPPLNTQHQHHNTTLQQPPWNPPVLPGSLRPKTPKETEIPVKEIKNTELPESNLSDQDDRKESPESDKASSKTEETNGSPSATSASGDKMTSGDKDDSVVAKKEVLSDDGCDEISPYPGSRARSPMSPPSPDAPMTYPPHFPHPFFASPPVGQRLQFGSPKGHHDPIATSGFPFGKDFGGRFPIPGLTPDMGLHGSPFMRPLPTNFDSLGKSGEDKDIFFCHLCSYSGKSKSEFDSHMNIHFEFNCPHCDYTSRTEGRLKRHIKDFHSDDSSRRSMPGRPKVYKCKQCQFSTTEKDKFWEHARTHIKEDKLLQCPNCPFVTEYKHHLEYHLRNHFNSKPFKCNKCNYSCVNKSMLNSHMKSHTNVYQYRCSNCTYATKYCHSLKLHLRKYNHKPATVLNQDGSLPQGLDAESSGLSIVAKRGPPRGPRCPKKDKNDPYLGQLFGMPPMGINTMLHGMMPFWPMLSHVGLPGHPSPQAGLLTNMGDFTRQNQLPMDDEDSSCHVIGNGDNSSDSNTSQTKDEEILPVPVNNKETPLDLTKPKSVSPTTFSNPNSPRKLDSDHEDNHVQDRSPHRSPESDNRKRPFENPIPSAPTQETSSRKRSRKGKAYKLDTFCMKLQEKQSSSNILDSDEQDSDMEINFERFQPLQSALKDKVVEEEETCFKRLDSVEEITTTVEGNDYKKDDDDDDTDRERSDAEDTDEYEVKNDETEIISQFKDKQDEINHAEKLNEEKTENDSDEESDFEKLQRVLNIINNEPEDSKIKPVEVDKIQKEEPAEVQSSEVKLCEKNDPESNTDDSKTDENKTETQLPSNISKGQGEAVDQVDMINTVLQNRKKPLPPAVRRGTELAWKLLHDPVNPVTSLPLPVDSPPILIQSEPVKPSTSLSMQSVITSTVQPNRNVLKHTQPLPYPQRPYPTPHPSQVMMNPPLPLPIPPTPMAFIPPTSHLMPEVPMARPSPKAKMAKPEEYSCTYCGLYFQDCVMYTVHMGYHSNQNPFKCNSCGIVCRDKVEFFLHIARSPHS